MAIAAVIGCNGQDGAFLCRHLLQRGYSVIGIGRQGSSRFSYEGQPFSYAALDLTRDGDALASLLVSQAPELVFHVAAVHASSGLAKYESVFQQMLMVNVGSLHTIMEYVRLHNPDARVLYASSAKVFGAPLPPQIDEDTPRTGVCLYATTKNAAGDVIRHYRRAHQSKVSQLYLFNHESELRPASFFIPKLVRALVDAASGRPMREEFATLDFYCDWGSADEYMDIAIDCLERAPGDDFVLATGRCLHAGELVTSLLAERDAVPRDWPQMAGRREPGQAAYQASTAKLAAKVGRCPRVRVEALVRQMVELELARAQR